MKACNVTDTLELALEAPGCSSANVRHKPSPLIDNGSSCIFCDLVEWLEGQGMDHVRRAPNHPQTQGRAERWHPAFKNRIPLENYHLQGALGAFVDHCKPPLPRESRQPGTNRWVLWSQQSHSKGKAKNQGENPETTMFAQSSAGRLRSLSMSQTLETLSVRSAHCM